MFCPGSAVALPYLEGQKARTQTETCLSHEFKLDSECTQVVQQTSCVKCINMTFKNLTLTVPLAQMSKH